MASGVAHRLRAHGRERGAAAVEGALVTTLILAPLLLGILYWGYWFWLEQRVSLYPPRLDQARVVGNCSEAEIVARVKSTVVDSLWALNESTLTGLGIGQDDLVNFVSVVVTAVPTIGVDVAVSVDIPRPDVLGGLVSLPGTGDLAYDLTQRLSYVSVATASGSGTGCSS